MRDSIEKSKAASYRPIVWTDADWDAIAWKLKENFPKRYFGGTHAIPVNLDEFEDAVEASLPQGRHKFFDDVAEVIVPLIEAFKRISGLTEIHQYSKEHMKISPKSESEIERKSPIKWTPEEWKTLTMRLENLFPGVSRNRYAALTFNHLRDAMKCLPVDRHRKVTQLPTYKINLIKYLGVGEKEPAIQENFHPVQPLKKPIPSPKSTSPIAIALAEAFEKPVEKKIRQRAHWSREDWLLIAKEMIRQNPHFDFFNSQFSHVDTKAIQAAQREVLPMELRRKTFHEHKKLRPKLLEIFAYLQKIQRLDKEQEASVEGVQEPIIEQDTVKESPVAALPLGQSPLPIPTGTISSTDTISTSDLSAKVTGAIMPIVNLLVEEIANRVSSRLMGALEAMLGGSPVQDVQPSAVAISIPQSTIPEIPPAAPSKPLVIIPKPTLAVKKPKIAVLGPFGRQKDFLNKAFPQYDFSYIEHSHGIREIAEICVLFVVSTRHMNLSSRDSIKKHVPNEKLRYVDGGLSNIKHQISVWEATNK